MGYSRDKNTKDSEDRSQARDGSWSNSCGSETTIGVVPLTKRTQRRMAWQGVKEEIFEKVPDGELITWYSSLVVQPKSKYTDVKKEETWMIRESMVMGIPNKSMRSTTKSGGFHLPFTRLQDFHKAGSKTQGYHQLALDPTTRQVATSSTAWGNYRPRRLVLEKKPHKTFLIKWCLESLGT